MPRGLRDSKQILEDDRERLFDKVASWCTAWAVGHSAPDECDRLGMTAALALATRRAFFQLPEHLLPDAVVLDGKFDFVSRPKEPSPAEPPGSSEPTAVVEGSDVGGAPSEGTLVGLGTPSEGDIDEYLDVGLPASFEPVVHTVVKADASCVSVAAASVLAKVTRDRIMRASAESYPPFDFDRNKGYPSPTHQRALRGYGLSAIHRRTWVYVEHLPWADPESSRLRGGLVGGHDDALASDVMEDLVGAVSHVYPGHADDGSRPSGGSPPA
jgi:ribonuclease HII